MSFFHRALLSWLVIWAVSVPARGEEDRWGLWAGAAGGSPHILSAYVRREVRLLAVQYVRRLRSSRRLALEYTCDVIPALFLTQHAEQGNFYYGPGGRRRLDQRARTIWGMGLAPFGLRLIAAPERGLAPYLIANGGFAFTADKVPYQVDGGSALNFTFQIGAGIRWRAADRLDLLAGYSWWHLSNAGLALVNPGVDANLLNIGVLF